MLHINVVVSKRQKCLSQSEIRCDALTKHVYPVAKWRHVPDIINFVQTEACFSLGGPHVDYNLIIQLAVTFRERTYVRQIILLS